MANEQTVFDHELQREVVIGSKEAAKIIQGIIGVRGRIHDLGYFTPNLTKNITVNFRGGTYNALSKGVFVEKFLVFDNNTGKYSYNAGQDNIVQIRAFATHKGNGQFPYHNVRREYNAENNLQKFGDLAKPSHTIHPNNKALVPFTFGLEYETSCGYIPEEECFRTGLIPLRDGSITGIEYASVVLDSSKGGFELLEEQLELLRKYTEYDKECSLHIHFGNFPVSQKAISVLYMLAESLQSCMYNTGLLPRYTFDTRAYKASGKDYCKLLPAYASFEGIYNFLSGGTPFLGSLTLPHPGDQRHEAKWNVHARYYWCNIINMCFYASPKTVEMRFLRPSYNFNKIVNWIFIFSAILQYAIDFAKKNKGMSDDTTYKTFHKMFAGDPNDFQKIFISVYSPELTQELLTFMDNLRVIVRKQGQLGDSIGKLDTFDDPIITKNALEV